MLYMAKLGPDVITEEINIDDEEPTTDPEATAEPCVSVQCQKQIKGEIQCLIIELIFDRVSHPWLHIGITREL